MAEPTGAPRAHLDAGGSGPTLPVGPPRARHRPSRRWALSLVASTVALGIFFAPALLPGLQFLHRDTGRMHHPMKRWIAGELAQGRLPEWNPLGGLGAPVLAQGIDAVLHPFTVLTVLLPFELGFKLWVLLSYLLAALGGWWWGRRLRLGEAASAVAGLGFALSGYLVSTSDNLTYLTTMATLPLVFAAAHAWLEDGTPRALLGVGLASALCAAGGDPQAWAFLLPGIPAYGLTVVAAGPLRVRALRGAVGLVAAAVAAAPFVVPVLAWVPHSSRGEAFDWIEYLRYNMIPLRLAELVIPHLLHDPEASGFSRLYLAYAPEPWTVAPWVSSEYVGAAAAALAALGAIRRREGRWLLAAAALFAWFALGHHGGFGQLARALPLLGNVRYWEKAAVWIALFVAAGAAVGIRALADEPRLARRFAAGCAAAAALLLGAAALGALFPEALARAVQPGDHAEEARRFAANLRDGLLAAGLALGALAPVALMSRVPRFAPAAPALLALVVLVDLAAANARAYVLSPAALADLPSPFAERLRATSPLPRVVTPFELEHAPLEGLSPAEQRDAWGSRTLNSGWSMVRGVANFESYSALWPVRASRYRRRAGAVKLMPGVGMWGVSHTVVPDRPERAAEMNLPPPYRVVDHDPVAHAYLLELRHRPRAYLAGEVVTVDRRGAMGFALDDRSVAGDRTVLEGEVPAGYAPPEGRVEVADESPTRVRVRTAASGPALLVLNDVVAEGWTAEVDGAPAEILPANYLARSVWVPAGEHVVTFRYRTSHLFTGAWLAAAGAVALAAWAALSRRRGVPVASGPA